MFSQHVLALTFATYWNYLYYAFVSNLHVNHPSLSIIQVVFDSISKTTFFCHEATWSDFANPYSSICFAIAKAYNPLQWGWEWNHDGKFDGRFV